MSRPEIVLERKWNNKKKYHVIDAILKNSSFKLMALHKGSGNENSLQEPNCSIFVSNLCKHYRLLRQTKKAKEYFVMGEGN